MPRVGVARAACLCAFIVLGVSNAAFAATIAQWNFNSVPPDGLTDTGSTSPSVGAGTITAIGNVSASFAGADASDPAVLDDSGFQTTSFPSSGAANKSAGVLWAVSTSGYKEIVVSWDQRHSNAAAAHARLQYTFDVTVGSPLWVDSDQFIASYTTTTAPFYSRSVDLSTVAGIANNPKAGFRVVAEFGSTGEYVASRISSGYATNGTWRFDMVTVAGNPVPEPGGLLMLAAGVALVGARRSRPTSTYG